MVLREPCSSQEPCGPATNDQDINWRQNRCPVGPRDNQELCAAASHQGTATTHAAEGTQFEVLIVGGGPAGSAAAYTLASNGISTCVLDRSRFPRDKLCGGLLTLRSKKIFDRVFGSPWDQVIDATFHGISVFRHGVPLANIRDYSTLFAMQRCHFDNFLLRLAEAKGAVLRLGVGAKRIDPQTNTAILTDGSTARFAFLIGADGANSAIARSLYGRPFDPNTIGFALEQVVPRAELPRFPEVPEVHLSAAKWGYGWVFPKGDHAVIGVGALHRKNPDLKVCLHRLLLQRCGRIPPGSMQGAFLPYGDFRSTPGLANVLLVGDAAGLVDSMSGEGLAFAMQSGDAAARSILDSKHQPNRGTALDNYATRYQAVTRIVSLSNRYRPLVFLPLLEKLFARTLVGADILHRAYLDIFADELEYEQMPRLIRRQLYAGLLKIAKVTS